MADKLCFVIAPIGSADSETRKRSDQVLKHIIRPAVASCGYTPIRADEISEPGIITSQIIQHIVDDPLVLADLTDRNPNVFYELAIRHALRRPLVQIIAKGEGIPFDVAGMRTIPVDHHDLDSVEQAKAEIVKQIDAVQKPDAKIDTPISVAVALQTLRNSDNPERRSLADLLAMVADLRTAVSGIEQRLTGSPSQLSLALLALMLLPRLRHTESTADSDSTTGVTAVCPAEIKALAQSLSLVQHRTAGDPEEVYHLLREMSPADIETVRRYVRKSMRDSMRDSRWDSGWDSHWLVPPPKPTGS